MPEPGGVLVAFGVTAEATPTRSAAAAGSTFTAKGRIERTELATIAVARGVRLIEPSIRACPIPLASAAAAALGFGKPVTLGQKKGRASLKLNDQNFRGTEE